MPAVVMDHGGGKDRSRGMVMSQAVEITTLLVIRHRQTVPELGRSHHSIGPGDRRFRLSGLLRRIQLFGRSCPRTAIPGGIRQRLRWWKSDLRYVGGRWRVTPIAAGT